VPDLTLWIKLTRRELRIIIKLFGGGSSHGDSLIETVNYATGPHHRERFDLGRPRGIHGCVQSPT
jgi:hypothetical protein